MADGGSGRKYPKWWFKRICESGCRKYFCKRDRNKDGTVSIYTCEGRQTIPVSSTGECAPEEVIGEEKQGRIELALNLFVVANMEAAARERAGIKKRDMFVKECLTVHALARRVFHQEVVTKIEALAAKATIPEKAMNLRFQAERAEKAGKKEAWMLACVSSNVEKTWPEVDGPTVSTFEAPLQKIFVKQMRNIGYADNTIAMLLSYVFAAINHCDHEGMLLLKVPKALRRDKWMIQTEEEKSVQACTLEEFGKLMDTAGEREDEWRYMHTETTGARSNTAAEAVWECVDLKARRWALRPPGKRRTKKRRPTIAICPTLAAEMSTWTRDSYRIVTDGKGNPVDNGPALFIGIRDRAGLPHVTAKMVRSFVRTWLMLMGVPAEIADAFIGHADDGSATGKFYKVTDPKYQYLCVVAMEKLYTAVRPMVRRPIAVPPKQKTLSLVEALARAA